MALERGNIDMKDMMREIEKIVEMRGKTENQARNEGSRPKKSIRVIYDGSYIACKKKIKEQNMIQAVCAYIHEQCAACLLVFPSKLNVISCQLSQQR